MKAPPGSLSLSQVTVGALSGISLSVAPGEVVCLSGASGSGKSRLLRAIADVEAHTGRVRLGDMDQADVPAHVWRRQVMMVPAESQWWFEQVGDHFADTPADRGLAALGFAPDVMGWSVSRLSSGEKQRLALLRVLALEPTALLLDEPTSNLDQDRVKVVEHWLLETARYRRLPVLWVAHDQSQIRRVADRHFQLNGHQLDGPAWA